MGKISVNEFKLGLLAWSQTIDADPAKRNIDLGTIVRDPKTGMFKDQDLINLLTASTEDCAGRPPCFKTNGSRV